MALAEWDTLKQRIGLFTVQYNKENASIQGKADACLLPIINTSA